jgi:ferredoxin
MNIRLIEEHKLAAPGGPHEAAPDARLLAVRESALAALDAIEPQEPLSTVSYRSNGHVLVIGAGRDALPWADRLAAALPVTVLLVDGDDGAVPLRIYPVLPAQAIVLTGWLGAYQATWQARGHAPQQGRFDLVLDLGAAPQIGTHQRPPGYQAPGMDDAARALAVDALFELVGDFEKPKYFAYKERLCAHGRNGRTGCNACIDICSAGAIAPAGDLIKVNPFLCAGCGACTTVCPSGALTYAYPTATHTGSRIKTLLRTWFDAGMADGPVVLLHGEPGAAVLADLAASGAALPPDVLPLALHHMASTGIDVWLAAIAWGARGVAVLATEAEAPQYLDALGAQMAVARAILSGLGYAGAHLGLVQADTGAGLAAVFGGLPRGEAPAARAGFNVALDKRNTLDYALDHLVRHAPPQADGQALPQEIALPAASPFGTLAVDKAACSLCMACVGACPASALQDGQNAPLLRFIEKNCVQCGLCADTCPEDAIRLVPRLLLSEERKQPVVLNETQPFHCIRCNKAFGTLRMVENMLGRLAAHPAFSDHLDRLRMCGDCRVVDMMLPADEMRASEVSRPGRFPKA